MDNLASALKHELCNGGSVCGEKSAAKGIQKERRGERMDIPRATAPQPWDTSQKPPPPLAESRSKP